MKTIPLGKSGLEISVVGQGCMGIGGRFTRDESRDAECVRALRYGIERGMTLIDTAEVYGGGHSEELVGEAIRGMRERVIVSTKVSPEHLAYDDVIRAAEGSLRRLKTEHIDLYQIHWPNPAIPVGETMRAMDRLVRDGKVRAVGVSNFDRHALEEVRHASTIAIVSEQIEYNLFDRWIEGEILPFCTESGLAVLAYSPLDQGRICAQCVLEECAVKYGRTVSQVALNWLAGRGGIAVIPKALSWAHIEANAESVDFTIDESDRRRIDVATKREVTMIEPDLVKIEGQGMYLSLDDACANARGFCPAPDVLAQEVRRHGIIKPIRVRVSRDNASYVLTEGQVRYWAWVMAFGLKRPVPTYIRTE